MRDHQKPSFWGSIFFCWHDDVVESPAQPPAPVRPCVAIVHQRRSSAQHQQPQPSSLKPLTMPANRLVDPPKGQFTPPEKPKQTPFSPSRPSMSVRERAVVYEHQQQQQGALLRSASSITDMIKGGTPISTRPAQRSLVRRFFFFSVCKRHQSHKSIFTTATRSTAS